MRLIVSSLDLIHIVIIYDKLSLRKSWKQTSLTHHILRYVYISSIKPVWMKITPTKNLKKTKNVSKKCNSFKFLNHGFLGI